MAGGLTNSQTKVKQQNSLLDPATQPFKPQSKLEMSDKKPAPLHFQDIISILSKM